MTWLVDDRERFLFKRCRRAWDLGARRRGNRRPKDAEIEPSVEDALREALAVYYFPGMWSWARDIVEPLALGAVARMLPDDAGRRRRAERTIEAYVRWAAGVDRFIPMRVAQGFEIPVPLPSHTRDPRLSVEDADEQALVTRDGEPVRYAARIDVLVETAEPEHWLVEHRFVEGDFALDEDLALDEASATHAFAWQRHFLGMTVAGTLFNEIRAAGPDGSAPRFRRRAVRRSPAEIAAHGERIALEALEMIDPGVPVYPAPSASTCAGCEFRRPCLALSQGADARPFLVAEFRERGDPPERATRLGGSPSSENRGITLPRPTAARR